MQASKEGKAKVSKVQRKQIVETIKTMLLVALVTGIASFIAGVHYQQDQAKTVSSEKAVTTSKE